MSSWGELEEELVLEDIGEEELCTTMPVGCQLASVSNLICFCSIPIKSGDVIKWLMEVETKYVLPHS